jgi:hypothetical protein
LGTARTHEIGRVFLLSRWHAHLPIRAHVSQNVAKCHENRPLSRFPGQNRYQA